jgi:hypothetical protein
MSLSTQCLLVVPWKMFWTPCIFNPTASKNVRTLLVFIYEHGDISMDLNCPSPKFFIRIIISIEIWRDSKHLSELRTKHSIDLDALCFFSILSLWSNIFVHNLSLLLQAKNINGQWIMTDMLNRIPNYLCICMVPSHELSICSKSDTTP